MDFGLAKASTQLEKTDPGVVKGKFSYLSPEAAMGREVDARADLFALGIVLWEMLAGRRLFLGESDFETVKLVQAADVPSLARINPAVDEEFEQILGRALARDRDERFASAREMGDALADYLFSHRLKVTSYDIAALVKEVLDTRISSPGGPSEHSIIDRLIQEELLRFTSLDELGDARDHAEFTGDDDEATGAVPLDASSFGHQGSDANSLSGDSYDAPRFSHERLVQSEHSTEHDSVRPGGLADALEENSVVSHIPSDEPEPDESSLPPQPSAGKMALVFFVIVGGGLALCKWAGIL